MVLTSLFYYLLDGIEAVRSLLLDPITSLPTGHPQAEETYQLLIRIVYVHTSRHASPAPLARDVLEQAIEAFPNNTIFLGLYLWGEAGARVYGRIQRLVSQLTSKDSGVVSLLWSVWAEGVGSSRTFWDEGGGGAERVRRALDRAINSTKYVVPFCAFSDTAQWEALGRAVATVYRVRDTHGQASGRQGAGLPRDRCDRGLQG